MVDRQPLDAFEGVITSPAGDRWHVRIKRVSQAPRRPMPDKVSPPARPVQPDRISAAAPVLGYIEEHAATMPWFDRVAGLPDGGCRQRHGDLIEYMIPPSLLQSLAGPGMVRQAIAGLVQLDALRMNGSGQTSHSIRAPHACRVYILKHLGGEVFRWDTTQAVDNAG